MQLSRSILRFPALRATAARRWSSRWSEAEEERFLDQRIRSRYGDNETDVPSEGEEALLRGEDVRFVSLTGFTSWVVADDVVTFLSRGGVQPLDMVCMMFDRKRGHWIVAVRAADYAKVQGLNGARYGLKSVFVQEVRRNEGLGCRRAVQSSVMARLHLAGFGGRISQCQKIHFSHPGHTGSHLASAAFRCDRARRPELR